MNPRWKSNRRYVLWAAVLLACAQALTFAYIGDDKVYPPPDYFTFLPPPVGGTYVDPVFGTPIKRISDARSTPDAGGGGTLLMIANEYSTMSPFNQDNSRLLLLHQSYFALYDGAGNFIKNLPLEMNATSEPRWSRRSPNLIYYVSGNQLKQYDVITDQGSAVHVFTEYASVRGHGESDICFDGDHFVLAGDARYVFVYEVSTDRKGPVLDTQGRGFDSLYITPDDHVTVTWLQAGSDRYNGIELFDRSMNFIRQVTRAGGHMDVTRDVDGEEVLIWANAADPSPVCRNGIVKVRLSDGGQTCLLSLDWGLVVHVSGPDRGGWVVVSTYFAGDPLPDDGWLRYTNEILQIRLDGSEVRRLAHHRSRPFNDYWWQPRASVSRDGGRLVYTSDYGLQLILGYPPEYTDVYLMTLRFEEREAAVQCWPCPWFRFGDPAHSGGSAMLAMTEGATVDFSFTGTGASWIAYRDRWAGIARTYVDGSFQQEVDTYASPAQARAVMFTIHGLAPGPHHLVVEATGEKNPSSGGAWVWVDAFESVALPAFRFEEGDPSVRCSPCPWLARQDPLLSGGKAIRALDAGAQASFTFTGTGASWIGYRDEQAGIARVYVDGVFQAEVDTYASPAQAQAVVFTVDDLAAGTHWLVVEATGSKNPASGGAWVWVDAFQAPL